MLSEKLDRVASGVNLPECPRWHDARLWFIDMYGRAIWQWDPGKGASIALETEDDPGGLGWLPNGDLLFVQMRTRKLMRLTAAGPALHCDLSVVHGTYLNDMVVDDAGRAYVDNTTRRDLGEVGPDHILIVEADGSLRVGTDKIESSNGLAVTPDGKTLIASQPPLHQISAATITDSGDLTDIRVWNRTDRMASASTRKGRFGSAE
jgi:sugar lactone lactonase YvrE